MNDPPKNWIEFEYQGAKYAAAIRVGLDVGIYSLRGIASNGHGLVSVCLMPEVRTAIDIWLKNGWDKTIPLQDVIDGIT